MATTLRKTMGAALAALALGSLGLVEVASAQPAGGRAWHRGMHGMGPGGPGLQGPMRGGPGRDGGLLLRRLNLTEAQRDQVRAINAAHREEFRALAEKTRAAREALRTATQAEPVDEAAIRPAAAAMADVHAEQALLHARVRSEIQQVLTPEQREQAKQLASERAQRLEERRERLQQRLDQRRERRQVPPGVER